MTPVSSYDGRLPTPVSSYDGSRGTKETEPIWARQLVQNRPMSGGAPQWAQLDGGPRMGAET